MPDKDHKYDLGIVVKYALKTVKRKNMQKYALKKNRIFIHKVMKRILCLFGIRRDRLENNMQMRITDPSPA